MDIVLINSLIEVLSVHFIDYKSSNYYIYCIQMTIKISNL